jgi:hypothetical protein
MITSKEKADELYVACWYFTNDSRIAKECALIAVEELIKETGKKYWYEVRQEIELS